MSSGKRSARAVLLCEDVLTRTFLRQLVKGRGDQTLRVNMAPPGRNGAAHVLREFPKEAVEHRRRAPAQKGLCLIAAVDADHYPVTERRAQMLDQLTPPRRQDERVAVLVPKWEINTWVEYLLNGGPVDENIKGYPDYKGAEKKCHPAVEELLRIVSAGVPADCPDSLRRAISEEYPRLP